MKSNAIYTVTVSWLCEQLEMTVAAAGVTPSVNRWTRGPRHCQLAADVEHSTDSSFSYTRSYNMYGKLHRLFW